jgi:hypothetical protein
MPLKKALLLVYSLLMAIAAVYVPWKIDYQTDRYSTELGRGYAFFWSPPIPAATIDYGKVLLEFVAISAICGVLFVLLKSDNS